MSAVSMKAGRNPYQCCLGFLGEYMYVEEAHVCCVKHVRMCIACYRLRNQFVRSRSPYKQLCLGWCGLSLTITRQIASPAFLSVCAHVIANDA